MRSIFLQITSGRFCADEEDDFNEIKLKGGVMKTTTMVNRFVLLFLCNLFHLIGCATVEQTIYLGDVEVSAPICPPPTHININKDVGNVTI